MVKKFNCVTGWPIEEIKGIVPLSYSNKSKRKRQHDANTLNLGFCNGDNMFLFNDRMKLFLRNLTTKWSGPFMVINVYSNERINFRRP